MNELKMLVRERERERVDLCWCRLNRQNMIGNQDLMIFGTHKAKAGL